jgi:hypothetical protein
MTVAQAIDTLPESHRDVGHRLLQQFLSAWAALQQAFEIYPYRVCPHGDPSEYTIPSFHVANPLRLAHVLNSGSADTPDIVLRMLRERLLPAVHDVLQSTDLEFLRKSTSSVNRLGANAECVVPNLSLELMPPPFAVGPLVLTGSRVSTGSQNSGSGTLDSSFERFIAAHGMRSAVEPAGGVAVATAATTPQWTFDVLAIVSFLLSRYIAGRSTFSIGELGHLGFQHRRLLSCFTFYQFHTCLI